MKNNEGFGAKKNSDFQKNNDRNFNNKDYNNKQNTREFQTNKTNFQKGNYRKQEETVADIIEEVKRIEKEIKLEISEIKNLKLSL